MYHDILMKTAQKLAHMAKITLRLEISGQQTDENVQFAAILHKCGLKLSDIGDFLKSKATEITSTCASAAKPTTTTTASTSKEVPVLEVPAKNPEKHKHEHYYEIPIATPSKTTVVYNDEISEVPKGEDDDRNMWHEPNIGNQCGPKRRQYHVVQMRTMMVMMMAQIKMMETLPSIQWDL